MKSSNNILFMIVGGVSIDTQPALQCAGPWNGSAVHCCANVASADFTHDFLDALQEATAQVKQHHIVFEV
ncbi:MAG: hypothetical protein ACKPKO_01375, partial [Candidatus Fonsibacter sp.]